MGTELFKKAFFGFALWAIPHLAGSLQNTALPHTAVSKIKRSSRNIGAARSAATASHPSVEHATEGIKKKNPADVTPLGFCKAFFKSVDQAATSERRDSSLSLQSFLSRERKRVHHTLQQHLPAFSLLEGWDTAFPSPQTPLPQGSSRDSSKTLGSSIKLLRLRSRGECRRHSFRSLAAYCSSSAHPRDICRIGFARMEMLAKYIRMRTARSAATASHPSVERATEGIV